MPIPKKYLFGGKIVDNPLFDLDQIGRAARYGDGLFESIYVAEGRCRNLEAHFARLTKGMETLGLAFAEGENLQSLEKACQELAEDYEKVPSRLRLNVHRKGKGLFLPAENEALVWLEIQEIFAPKTTGPLHVGFVHDFPLSHSPLSLVKTTNSLPYILASMKAKANEWDDALLRSVTGELAELTSSNIFLVIDGQLLTPRLESGCLPGTTRQQVLKLAKKFGIPCREDRIDPSQLKSASEVFCTNAIAGLRPVGSIAASGYSAIRFPVLEHLQKHMWQ